MTFEYRDQYSGYINAGVFLNRALVIKTNPHGCFVDPARVEEVVAGIRDAARTAAGDAEMAASLRRDGFGEDEIVDIMQRPIARTAARQTTGQDDTEPLPPRAERCPEPECAEGRECWRCDYEESQHAARLAAPAVGQPVKVRVVSTRPEPVALTNDAQDLVQATVGQPAEAHDTDRAALDRAFKDTRTRALIDAAETLTEACPDHGTGTTCTVRCYCDAADIIRRMTDGSQL
ncbi:hypothetical protein [Streptomyces hydrogenans]